LILNGSGLADQSPRQRDSEWIENFDFGRLQINYRASGMIHKMSKIFFRRTRELCLAPDASSSGPKSLLQQGFHIVRVNGHFGFRKDVAIFLVSVWLDLVGADKFKDGFIGRIQFEGPNSLHVGDGVSRRLFDFFPGLFRLETEGAGLFDRFFDGSGVYAGNDSPDFFASRSVSAQKDGGDVVYSRP
jgi:hypothetical protein